jgi:hypothetical protein
VGNVEKILKLVTSINVKEKECDFFRLYVYLVLMDNLLFSSDAFRDKTQIVDTWRNYLRNCSTQIACTNWGFYAPKVKKFDWLELLTRRFLCLGSSMLSYAGQKQGFVSSARCNI